MPARYEYVNGNIKYIHEYAYTTGTLPSNPIKTTEYHYEDSTWADVLTGVSQYRYTASNTSTYGLRNNSSSSFEEYVRSILGDDLGDYEIVDLSSRALLNLEPENSDASTYSLPGNTSLRFSYSVESDAIGNITYIDGIEIEWDGRRAVAVQQGDNTITYEYNIDGKRTKKTVNGVTTEYFYNGDILAGQKTGNDIIIFMYDNNGDIFGFEYNGTPYYYVKNAQNDVVMVLNCNDRTAVVYQYDAWGNITDVYDSTTQRVSNINPITYRSYYYDIEMGVYYLNSRYYVPIICRFLSADEQLNDDVLGNNMFSYCSNNPVHRTDESGSAWWVPASALVGGVLGAVGKIASNIITKNTWYEGVVGAFAGGAVGGAVAAATGSLAAACYAGAAVESVVNQAISYTSQSHLSGSKQKTFTKNNIINSTANVVKDTVVNGCVSHITGSVAGKIIPTNDNWFTPVKLSSSFFGRYAVKSELQGLIQTAMGTGIESVRSLLSVIINDGQDGTIVIYPEAFVEEAIE